MKEERQRPYPLRLEPELSQWVKERARDGYRSFNAEINSLIRKAKEASDKKQTA